jgi:flagella basal body P-ring formation protein FlgA
MPRIIAFLLSIGPLAAADTAPCVAVDHDQITAHDLVPVYPVFARLAPEAPIAPAPMPGARRVVRSFELAALARKNSLQIDQPQDLCFEWAMEPIDRGRILEALQKALPYPDAQIDILETSLYEIPRGRIEFRYEDLGVPATPEKRSAAIWRGNVVYGDNHRYAIWARVMMSVRLPRMIAKETIQRGQPIMPEMVKVEMNDVFPAPGDIARNLGEIAGQVPLRTIPAGKEVHLGQVVPPPDVARGDPVDVEVRSGGMRLAFRARSESDGRHGEVISLRNPTSNRIFQARVEGKDKASIDVGVTPGN